MKLITFKKDERSKAAVGVLHKNEQTLGPIDDFDLSYTSMNDLILNITDEEMSRLKEATESEKEFPFKLDEIQMLAPIPVPRQDVICLGINYEEHAKESARFKKEAFELNAQYPVYFSKRVNEALGQNGKIPSYDTVVDSLDYEVELAVIIGKDAKNVSKEHAKEYIFGYTILNDMSARNLQTRHKQWYLGKSLDGFTPMGPWIVTEEEIPYPPELDIQSFVNDEPRQNGNTRDFINDIGDVIEDLSRCMVIKAGSIISMGTPKGVGMGFEPPRFLKTGDEVICRIEKIGTLSNQIV